MTSAAAATRKNGELILLDSGSRSKFALLYNGEGIKYTIGQRFESRESQGEYLFCYGDGVSKSSHCEITCGDEGTFWVKDLEGLKGQGTFINEERIDDKVRIELKFGDVLSLGGPGAGTRTEMRGSGDANKLSMEAGGNSKGQGQGKGHDGCTTFLFKAAEKGFCQDVVVTDEVDEDQSQGSQSVEVNENVIWIGDSTPLRNTLVLSKIFAHLKLSDVKKCRLVCSEWNEEATKLLKTKGSMAINYFTANQMQYDLHGFATPGCAFESSRLFSFVQEMGGFFRDGRFSVLLPNCTQDCICGFCSTEGRRPDDSIVRQNSERKMLSDLEWFFNGGFPHRITKLTLCGSLRSRLGHNLMFAILDGCRHHLQDLNLALTLYLDRDTDVAQVSPPAPLEINFKSLKKLTVHLDTARYHCSGADDSDLDDYFQDDFCELYEEPSDQMLSWITSMINGAPTLESLKLRHCECIFKAFGEVFLREVVREKGFPMLNSLNLMSYNCSVLESILQLPNLWSLTLGWLNFDFEHSEGRGYDDDDDDGMPWTRLMGLVLQKSAQSFKYLDLDLPYFHADTRNRDTIVLPVFPKLKVFKLEGFYSKCVKLPDMGLGLTFQEYFPVLEVLNVIMGGYPYNPAEEKNFFDVFFPNLGNGVEVDNDEPKIENNDVCTSKSKEDAGPPSGTRSSQFSSNKGKERKKEEQVVKSVRFLEISNLEKWSQVGVDKIDELFPNALNKHLESVGAKSFVSGAELMKVQ